MDENCLRNCPVSDRVESLESQLDEYQAQNSSTHKEIFDRLRKTETQLAVTSDRYNTIIEKLNNLTSKVSELEQKPGKRWESLVVAVLGTAVGVLVAFLFRQAGVW